MKSYALQDIDKVLISEEEIKNRVLEIAKQLEEDYKNSSKLLLICILRGAYAFFSDLTRSINLPIEVDFMAISSYGMGSTTSGEVRVVKDLSTSIEDKDVLVVEDIIDSGYTINYLKNMLKQRKPKSVKVCSLLNKQARREVDVNADYIGFDIPNDFIVGYGLDYAEKYRNLKYIGVLSEEIYKK